MQKLKLQLVNDQTCEVVESHTINVDRNILLALRSALMSYPLELDECEDCEEWFDTFNMTYCDGDVLCEKCKEKRDGR